MTLYGRTFEEEEWIDFQLEYLQHGHVFYTETAKNIRKQGKESRIRELKRQKEELQETKS
jgi:hypothetical protein